VEAVPQYHGMFVCNVPRGTSFKKHSLKVPDTWRTSTRSARSSRRWGNRSGFPISQNYDSISTAGPVLWSFGGMEVDRDGKDRQDQLARHHDRRSSGIQEDVQGLAWSRKCISWSDAEQQPSSIQQGQAGWIHNLGQRLQSIAKQRKLVTADGINHHRSLGGPMAASRPTRRGHIGIWKFTR